MPRNRLHSPALVAAAALAALTTVPARAEATPASWQTAARTASLSSAPPPPTRATVCVVDTGVDLVPAVADNVDARITLLADPDVGDGAYSPADPASAHGTYVAAFAVRTWPWVRIISVRIGTPSGVIAGRYRQAIRECIEAGADVVNLSLGTTASPTADERTRLLAAVEVAAGENVDIVAAAGNDPGPTIWPASALTSHGIAVGAVGESGVWCSWASRGPEVLVGAPACALRIPATHDAADMVMHGSSFAAPQVSAVLAAIHSYAPQLTAAQRRAAMTGLPSGMLDGDEVLRRIGRADLIVPPISGPPPTPMGTGKIPTVRTPQQGPMPGPRYFTTADDLEPQRRSRSKRSRTFATARLKARWTAKRRVQIRSSRRLPSGVRIQAQVRGARTWTRRTTRLPLTLPRTMARPGVRITVRLTYRSKTRRVRVRIPGRPR